LDQISKFVTETFEQVSCSQVKFLERLMWWAWEAASVDSRRLWKAASCRRDLSSFDKTWHCYDTLQIAISLASVILLTLRRG